VLNFKLQGHLSNTGDNKEVLEMQEMQDF